MKKLFVIKPPKWVYLIFIIGIGTLSIRLLLDSRFANSALLYVATPFLVSFLIFQFTPKVEKDRPFRRYISHLRDATIVMLGTSAFLFEGFLCVLFFMPIYYIGVTIGFVFDLISTENRETNGNKLRVSIIPLLVGIAALEGTAPSTSFERKNEVTRTIIVDRDIQTLQANMALPIDLPRRRHWFLSIFPLPTDVDADSLKAGDVHKLEYIYKRWFFTNIQQGEFYLRIDSVSGNEVTTSATKNTSYLSKYLKIKGTQISFEELDNGRTEISLTISYDRLLDPAWYFGPMQRFAIEKSGDYFVQSVFVREEINGS